MAVILQMTYMKKLGLPNYSSHSCSVQLTVEIPDASMVGQETTKLYQLLQDSVDHQIQEVGFMPDATTYGMNNQPLPPSNGSAANGNTGQHTRIAHHRHQSHGNGYGNGNNTGNNNGNGRGDVWNCTDGQRGFVLRLVNENRDKLTMDDVERLASDLFGISVRQLDKMQASQVIEELLERVGKKPQRSRWHQQRQPARQ